MRADLSVQMAKAKAQSAATRSGSELVCAAVQQGKTLNSCLSCPLFVYEQGITSTVCVKIC